MLAVRSLDTGFHSITGYLLISNIKKLTTWIKSFLDLLSRKIPCFTLKIVCS